MTSEVPCTSQGSQHNYDIIKNRNGGKTLLHSGHGYTLLRKNKESSVWTCVNRRHKKCTGSVKLGNQSGNVQIQMKHITDCQPNDFKNEIKLVMDKIRKEVKTNFGSIKKIFESHTAILRNRGFDAEIPVYTDVKTALYSERNKALKVPKTKFKEPSDVVIPEKFKKHILIDYNLDNNRIIIFACKKTLTDIKKVCKYYCNGTFDYCPTPFQQILTIHSDFGCNDKITESNVVPMFHILLTNKEKDTYKTMFTQIKLALPEFNPQILTLDFQLGKTLAIEDVFPEAFKKNDKKQSLEVMNQEETLIKQEIEDNSCVDEKGTEMNDYFVTQWLEPDDMMKKLCCYKQEKATKSLTEENLTDAWNQRLQSFLGRKPSLLSFFEIIDVDYSTNDTVLERLDALESSDLEVIRQQRLKEMKNRAKQQQEWLANGHGEYIELDGEKEFFTICNKSDNVVCHFYKNGTERCRIVDMHLKVLAKKHVETKFVKLDVERAPFLTERLKVRVIPTIGLVKQNKTKDFIIGFTDLGNRDDFSTEMLEWRIARSEVIEYNGDLAVPPAEARKQKLLNIQSKKTIRGKFEDSDSDLDLSD